MGWEIGVDIFGALFVIFIMLIICGNASVRLNEGIGTEERKKQKQGIKA